MKVRKTSWHYKLLTGCTGFKPSTSLCAYFWQVMFATFFAAPIILSFAAVIMLCLGIDWAARKTVGRFVAWALSLIPAKKLAEVADVVPPPSKEPGLLRSWWKAKKDRVCPIIEFTDAS